MQTPAVTAHRGRSWRHRAMIFLAVLVAAVGGLAVAGTGPAYASTSVTYCFPIWQNGVMVLYCIEVPYAIDPRPCLCPDYGIELVTNPVLRPDEQRRYLGELGEGLELLGQAAANPRDAQRLRERALESFRAAGADLANVEVRLGQVGVADVKNARVTPSPQPWLVSAGADLVDGLQLMQLAALSPEPTPYLEQGLAEFAAALDQLAAAH